MDEVKIPYSGGNGSIREGKLIFDNALVISTYFESHDLNNAVNKEKVKEYRKKMRTLIAIRRILAQLLDEEHTLIREIRYIGTSGNRAHRRFPDR